MISDLGGYNRLGDGSFIMHSLERTINQVGWRLKEGRNMNNEEILHERQVLRAVTVDISKT